MVFTDKNGLKIYYEVHGEGDTVVLLHHGFGTTEMWREICPALQQDYQIVIYDRRGYGRSEMGTGFKDFYLNRYRPESVEELEQLRQELKVDSFHIIGQCEGGVIGVDFAVRYPQFTKSLVISSTLCYGHTPMKELNASYFPKPFQDKNPEYKKKFIQWHGKDKAESHYNMFRTYGGAYGREIFDLREQLPRVQCPTLIIYPDRSTLFEVEQGVSFYRHIPNSELAVFANCGHNTYEKQPEEYTRQVRKFLKKQVESSDGGDS